MVAYPGHILESTNVIEIKHTYVLMTWSTEEDKNHKNPSYIVSPYCFHKWCFCQVLVFKFTSLLYSNTRPPAQNTQIHDT